MSRLFFQTKEHSKALSVDVVIKKKRVKYILLPDMSRLFFQTKEHSKALSVDVVIKKSV